MRLIVTRPEHDARRWVHDLQAAGHEALALPLIRIGPVPDTAHLHRAWLALPTYVGAMFVSGNAAHYFFKSKPAFEHAGIAQLAPEFRAWAPGPGTANALRRAGLPAACLDAPDLDAGQFDSETLWRVVAHQVHPGDRVLIVRGVAGDGTGAPDGPGRDWFAAQVMLAGGMVDFVTAYQRHGPDLSPSSQALARAAASDGSLWLLSSSEAVANLCQALPGQSWQKARALATHPRIAAAARAAGFGVVLDSRPLLSDVLASIESLA